MCLNTKTTVVLSTILLYFAYIGSVIFATIEVIQDFDHLKTCAMGRFIIGINVVGSCIIPFTILYLLKFIVKRKFIRSYLQFDIANGVLFICGLVAVCFYDTTCASDMSYANNVILSNITWSSMIFIIVRIADTLTGLFSVTRVSHAPLLDIRVENTKPNTDEHYDTTQEYTVGYNSNTATTL